jgi:hypothetical protein
VDSIGGFRAWLDSPGPEGKDTIATCNISAHILLMCLGIQIHPGKVFIVKSCWLSLSFFIFFKKIANPLTFPAENEKKKKKMVSYGTGQKRFECLV